MKSGKVFTNFPDFSILNLNKNIKFKIMNKSLRIENIDIS